MATPKQNYARQFQAYAQGIEPDIPASVKTYSIFNPDTGTWQRMTNGFRSPIPAQGQTPVVPAQPMIQTKTPGILLRPKQQAQPQPAQITRPLARSNARTNVKPKVSDYNSDDAILRVADIPPEVTLGTQPVVRAVPVNMSPDYQIPIPYVSNETAGLAGYDPNIAYTQNQLALGKHYRQPIPIRPLTVAEHLTRLFGGDKAKEASNAIRIATGLPPLE